MSALGHGTGTVRGRPTASPSMTDVTRILLDIERGDTKAAEQLLPLVYEELRKLAAQKLARERPGQTLQATALVHEAYLRLVGRETSPRWDSCRHFFAAAAEAMRRILVDDSRRKYRLKRKGDRRRAVDEAAVDTIASPVHGLVALDDALEVLGRQDSTAAQIARLKDVAGLTLPEISDVMGIAPRSVDRHGPALGPGCTRRFSQTEFRVFASAIAF